MYYLFSPFLNGSTAVVLCLSPHCMVCVCADIFALKLTGLEIEEDSIQGVKEP